MFNDGYDAYCHQLISASSPNTRDNGTLCGCSEYLRSLACDNATKPIAKSN